VKVYLAGNVPKSEAEENNYVDWRAMYAKVIRKKFDAHCIDPRAYARDESDFKAIFELDCKHIKGCDMVVVNAESRLGPGTSMEMAIAKHYGKAVVTVLPKNSVHRKNNVRISGQLVDDWIHPFVYATSDLIVERVENVEMPADVKRDIF